MSEYSEGDTVLVQLEADVLETYHDGAADIDADGTQIHVEPREVISVVKESSE